MCFFSVSFHEAASIVAVYKYISPRLQVEHFTLTPAYIRCPAYVERFDLNHALLYSAC